MWAKVFRLICNLIYAAAGLSAETSSIPVSPRLITSERGDMTRSRSAASKRSEAAALAAADELRSLKGAEPSIAVLQDGPYGISGRGCKEHNL